MDDAISTLGDIFDENRDVIDENLPSGVTLPDNSTDLEDTLNDTLNNSINNNLDERNLLQTKKVSF